MSRWEHDAPSAPGDATWRVYFAHRSVHGAPALLDLVRALTAEEAIDRAVARAHARGDALSWNREQYRAEKAGPAGRGAGAYHDDDEQHDRMKEDDRWE